MSAKESVGSFCKRKGASIINVAGLLFGAVYLLLLLCLNFWLLFTGVFNRPILNFIDFLSGPSMSAPQQLEFGDWRVVAALVLMNVWFVIITLFAVRLFKKTWPNARSPKLEKILDQPTHKVVYSVLAFVLAEEVLFRWIPLAVIYPMFGNNFALGALVVASSALFGLVHIYNFEKQDRKLFLILPHTVSGLVFCFIFIYYGFLGAVLVHFAYNIMLILPYKVQKQVFKNEIKVTT